MARSRRDVYGNAHRPRPGADGTALRCPARRGAAQAHVQGHDAGRRRIRVRTHQPYTGNVDPKAVAISTQRTVPADGEPTCHRQARRAQPPAVGERLTAVGWASACRTRASRAISSSASRRATATAVARSSMPRDASSASSPARPQSRCAAWTVPSLHAEVLGRALASTTPPAEAGRWPARGFPR